LTHILIDKDHLIDVLSVAFASAVDAVRCRTF
jgi:hypothetical protein